MFGTPIDEGSQHDNKSIQLSTKKGKWIDNVRMSEKLPGAMKEAEKYAKKNCPGIQTRSLSSSYNCVGMIFASRRVWIDTDQLPNILNGDEYVRVPVKANLIVGDLVIYKQNETSSNIDHIGVIICVDLLPATADVKILVLSQWGRDGEYIHFEDNVPVFYGKFREYYSERKLP